MSAQKKSSFADRKMIGRAIRDSFVKLDPRTQLKNPVMFLVYLSAILTSALFVASLFGAQDAPTATRLLLRSFCG